MDEYFSDVDVIGVLCTSDAGLADAERLQHLLVPERSNGIKPARRDKWAMVEAMRSAGLAASDQAATDTWEELKAFLDAHDYPVVLKPRRGQASILVGLAHDEDQARACRRRWAPSARSSRSTAATSTSAARASASCRSF